MNKSILIATVESLAQPQPRQKHRSSGNFSTENVPGGFNKFRWEITGVSKPESIKFNVMRDKSGGKDPTEYQDLVNGSVTEIKKYRNLYIADPKGADGESFLVKVYATNY